MVRRLADLKLLPTEENAQFMEAEQFDQLVENLRIDGVLTSTPLVYRDTVISGNHRVEAAIAAGIEEAVVIEITNDIPPDRARALQLSHNGIVGKSDEGRLANLYANLDLGWKKFSGLDDSMFAGLRDLSLKKLAIGTPTYQELRIQFLPEQADLFLAALAKAEKLAKKGGSVLLARFEDFDTVFRAVVAAKKVRGLVNSAVAMRTIAELALGVLEKEAAEKDAAKEGDHDGRA